MYLTDYFRANRLLYFLLRTPGLLLHKLTTFRKIQYHLRVCPFYRVYGNSTVNEITNILEPTKMSCGKLLHGNRPTIFGHQKKVEYQLYCCHLTSKFRIWAKEHEWEEEDGDRHTTVHLLQRRTMSFPAYVAVIAISEGSRTSEMGYA